MAKSDSLVVKELLKLKSKRNYKKIDKGFFNNQPEIEGYVVELDTFENNPIFVVINTNPNYQYTKEFVRFGNYSFIIINNTDLDNFIDNLIEYISDIISYFKEILQNVKVEEIKKNDGLPFGYDYDEDKNIVVNSEEASIVRRIFKEYINLQSIRKVASAMKSSYSVIRDILYDDRYARMDKKIIPDQYLNRVYSIMKENRKNKQGRISDKRKNYEISKSRLSRTTRTKVTDNLFNKDEKADRAEQRERN